MSSSAPLQFVPTLAPEELARANFYGLVARLFCAPPDATLLQAIEQHKSEGSEANTVIGNFNALSDRDQQNILNFLRSL